MQEYLFTSSVCLKLWKVILITESSWIFCSNDHDSVKLTRRKTRCLFSCQSFMDSRLLWQQITVTVEPSMCLTGLFKPSFTFDIEKSLYIWFFMYICSFICKESCSQWLWPPWCTFDDQNLFFALLYLSALLCPSLSVGAWYLCKCLQVWQDRIGGNSL